LIRNHARLLTQPAPPPMTHCQREAKVKVTHGHCLQSGRAWHVTATTNHTLSYKLNRAIQKGQLEMHS